MALSPTVQMISEKGVFLSSYAHPFVEELNNYTVISIIGPQSSGKSYLLNKLFQTKFDQLDAKEGRKQTTRGIWMAKCIKPCMIIMDVEGFDGTEREDDTLFERQSSLFSLTVSDVLLLNMWFHDIGRQKGASLGLLKLIFEERAKIEATKTTIIIVVRDHDYDETSPDITRKDLERRINELWQKVHPATTNRIMSDYIEVVVKDFPHKCQKDHFDQKSKDLANFLCSFAESESLEQTQNGPSFAVSSERIWDLIRSNKKITAADHKLAKSKYMCKKLMKVILGSLDEDKRYKSVVSSISAKKFPAEFFSVHKDIMARYEEETRSSISSVRDKRKAKLEKELVNRFEKILDDKIISLRNETLSSAESKIRPELENIVTLNKNAVIGVIQPYLKEYDDNTITAADLQNGPYQDFAKAVVAKREEFVKALSALAEDQAHSIQMLRRVKLGCIITAKIIIGTTWAAATCDPSMLLSAIFT